MNDTTAAEAITIDCDSVELHDGENLRALTVGDTVELDHTTRHPGLWIVTQFHGEFQDRVTLHAAEVTEDCAALGIGCCFSGTRHAHPVSADGTLRARPSAAEATR
ncbi:hypothetical protein [Streptomyces sp. SBT349]|uniref:hypothetical protein n=1 Tax=Streptomyces sp. SBT349 TaxID=1580539 RepID=UPI00066AF879|nr:hypothetical protein [Streptomyces sp. SBT349]